MRPRANALSWPREHSFEPHGKLWTARTTYAAMRCVSTAPPRLLPIFRIDTQLQILGATYLEPERRFTNPEVVGRSQRPQPTVARVR